MKKNKTVLLYLMIAISIILCIPSILYLIMNKTVDQFNGYYTYTLVKTGNLNFGILNGVIVVGLMLIFSIISIVSVKLYIKKNG